MLVEPERDIVVLAARDEARRLARLLEAVELQRIRGYGAGGIRELEDEGIDLATAADVRTCPYADAVSAPMRHGAGDANLPRETNEREKVRP